MGLSTDRCESGEFSTTKHHDTATVKHHDNNRKPTVKHHDTHVVKDHVVKTTSSRSGDPVDNSLKTKEKTPETEG